MLLLAVGRYYDDALMQTTHKEDFLLCFVPQLSTTFIRIFLYEIFMSQHFLLWNWFWQVIISMREYRVSLKSRIAIVWFWMNMSRHWWSSGDGLSLIILNEMKRWYVMMDLGCKWVLSIFYYFSVSNLEIWLHECEIIWILNNIARIVL